jgi:hypothetical protein
MLVQSASGFLWVSSEPLRYNLSKRSNCKRLKKILRHG